MINKNEFIIIINTAVKAGCAIMDIYNNENSDFSIEKKEDNSPVTIADKKAHQIIISDLKTLNIPILSEEGQHTAYEERKKWDYFLLVDPLDGTKEFIKRNGEFTVNIAGIYNNAPIHGVVYLPFLKQLYFSFDNKSYKYTIINPESFSFLNMDDLINKSKKISPANRPKNFTVIASRSHKNPQLEDFIKNLEKEHKDLNLISAGSSLKFCKMAEGQAHVYPRTGPTMEWDTAAGHSICLGAGLKVKIFGSEQELQYNKENLKNPYFIIQ